MSECYKNAVRMLQESSIYILNDIQDIEKDRLHPKKKNRPIASGAVSVIEGLFLLLLSLVIAVLFNAITSDGYHSYIWLGFYFLLNVLYSKKLKDVPIVDVVILVSGFLIRLMYGGVVTNVVISRWLYLTVIMVSFYMGLGKRRNELGKEKSENNTRRVLKYYNYAFLDKNMYLSLGLAEAFYALWAIDSPQQELLWTVPLIIIIGMKYSLNIEGESDGDPVEVILKDKYLWVLGLIYMILVAYIIYWR